MQTQFPEGERKDICGAILCALLGVSKEMLYDFFLLICALGETSLNFEYLIGNVLKHPIAA